MFIKNDFKKNEKKNGSIHYASKDVFLINTLFSFVIAPSGKNYSWKNSSFLLLCSMV